MTTEQIRKDIMEIAQGDFAYTGEWGAYVVYYNTDGTYSVSDNGVETNVDTLEQAVDLLAEFHSL